MKYIDPKEFVEFGYLQEVNRQFLHPLGLALAVQEDEQGNVGPFLGVWDERSDPEGFYFEKLSPDKAQRVRDAWDERIEARMAKLGYGVQPLDK